WDGGQRFRVGIVQVEDQQRRWLFAILLHAFEQVFIGLDELDLHIQLAGGLLNFGQAEQIVHESADPGSGLRLPRGQAFRFGRSLGGGEPRSWPRMFSGAAVLAFGDGAVAVIHGCGVDAIRIVAVLAVSALARSAVLAAIVRRTTSATASAPSSGAT